MADAAPKRLYPPIPPWRVHILGATKDLQDLAAAHSQGLTRVVHSDGNYYLESGILDGLSDPDQVFKKANQILRLIFGLARVRRFVASSVEAASVLWTDGSGNWVQRKLFASAPIWIVPSTRYLEGPDISERCLELAEANETVRMILTDFLGEWDFPRLRRIVDSVLIDLGGDKKRGAKEVLRLGWATQPECVRFDESVNFGREELFGAHSLLELAPGQNKNPMHLGEAVEFVRKLLAQWLASKINREVIPKNEGMEFYVPKP
jgi:hypothetical protein